MIVVQLDQVAPYGSPGAGGDDFAVLADAAPMPVGEVNRAGPAGMIDDHVQEDPGTEVVDGGG